MKVLVAGATGVIGRRVLPLLIDARHDVVGLTRSLAKAKWLQGQGVEAVICDALDREAVRSVVVDAQPEIVIHQLTDLPPDLDPRRAAKAYAANDLIRRVGTENLAHAAADAGARRLIAQSIAFAYAPAAGSASEAEALYESAPAPWADAVAAVQSLESAVISGVREGPRPDGVVLRYGFFYGPGTSYARGGHIARQVLARRFPIVGRGDGVFSFIHVDDAAQATVAAIDSGTRGIYNIVDDDPAPTRDWLPCYAEVLGARPPRRVPRLLARPLAGPLATSFATELRGASNALARRELDWEPVQRSWRRGFEQALGEASD